MLERGYGVGRDLVAVGIGDGEVGSGGGEGGGEDVAGFGGADEEEGFAWSLRDEGFGERFGYELGGDEIDCEADSLHCFCGGWTYGGDLGEWALRRMGRERIACAIAHLDFEAGHALVEDFDGVGAGKDEPVEGFQIGEGGVEGDAGLGWGDFDSGDEDRGRAEGFELGGEVGGLVAGSGDEDTDFSERVHWDDCSFSLGVEGKAKNSI